MVSGHAAENRLAEGVLEARVGVRDNVCPQVRHRAYRCAHLLAKSRVQPASSAAVRACAPSWPVDRVGVLEGAQAVRWHPQAAVVPWLWASQLDRESGLGNGLEGDSEGSLGVVDIF